MSSDTEDRDGEREQGDDFREMDFAAALLEMDGHVAALRKLMERSIKGFSELYMHIHACMH
jgi:hypothetical protein